MLTQAQAVALVGEFNVENRREMAHNTYALGLATFALMVTCLLAAVVALMVV